ncbi:nucleoside triphosphate pyrophosphohydrolase family protein [Terriglobus albidus]|uniref:nucleoside triphosphate pyrophosphohydrolase family protein n=1 Tax=Terriglobus albidus TaxID=1592106 RepID=UPI0021E0D4E3|nr:nucleoside triphosphate pyrophosphohydrolase family protein [Terriglobus albidus]
MDMNEYQQRAQVTSQGERGDQNTKMVALLGLSGETGSLLTLYKKVLRDGSSFGSMNDRIVEELGDVLWYVADIAAQFGLNLSDVADANLLKIKDRWEPSNPLSFPQFDSEYPEEERFPRVFEAEFCNSGPTTHPRLEVFISGQKFGSTLTDNAYTTDDYRYHDLLHLSFATVLGWSPVLRALLKRKRKSSPMCDEVEDGGRAAAVEEGLAALIFAYATQHSLLDGVTRLDWPLLRTCKEMTAHLEVSSRSSNDWEDAILQAFAVWREMKRNGGGIVICNLDSRRLRYQDPC